ncbi:diguanylate cyclase domain-containing protein [Nocardia sp. NPDC006044]|uniref:diguanylate cyclase domain-containing protein n=1 Tax=Nocardia sp. NPDC006044 TaxID=3364306 RepID=UPI00368DBF74
MDEIEGAALARVWLSALTEHPDSGRTPNEEHLLPTLTAVVRSLSVALTADPFNTTAGLQSGTALAAAGLTQPAVPSISAQVLQHLAHIQDDRAVDQRLAALLAALGQGHQAHLDLSSHDSPTSSAPPEDARFRIVFDNAAVAIAIGDTDGVLLDANQGLADMIGVPVHALRGISVYDFAHPDDRADIRKLVYQELVPAGTGTVKLERRLARADGTIGWAAFAITFVKGADGQADYLLAIGEDVTEQHRLRDELRRQARHDPLTGLPNRRHLLEQIEATLEAAGSTDRVGLCFADLDRFKSINDRYGHSTGDKMLSAVAARLRAAVEHHHCVLGRIGGDEFVALIPPPVDERRIAAISRSLVSALAAPISVGPHQLQVSASIGAVLSPVAGLRAESLLDAADTSLYLAKTNGRDQWVLHVEKPVEEPSTR